MEQDSHTSLSLRYFLFGSCLTLHRERPLARHLRTAVLHCDVGGREKGREGGRKGGRDEDEEKREGGKEGESEGREKC